MWWKPVVDASRGQFAVNGQRTDANYFTVDGVSANFSAGDAIQTTNEPGRHFSIGQSGGGMLPANNFLGTFSNLVSPDALQEFKIQTSTFAPEYGRSPGAQIGLITRSGEIAIPALCLNISEMTKPTLTIGSPINWRCRNRPCASIISEARWAGLYESHISTTDTIALSSFFL